MQNVVPFSLSLSVTDVMYGEVDILNLHDFGCYITHRYRPLIPFLCSETMLFFVTNEHRLTSEFLYSYRTFLCELGRIPKRPSGLLWLMARCIQHSHLFQFDRFVRAHKWLALLFSYFSVLLFFSYATQIFLTTELINMTNDRSRLRFRDHCNRQTRCRESIQFVGVTHTGMGQVEHQVSNFIRFIASLPSGIRGREKKKWKTLGLTYSYTVLSEKLD